MVGEDVLARSPLDPPLRLLACLAGSPQARTIAAESAAIARLLGAQLIFIHVRQDRVDPAVFAESLRAAGLEPRDHPILVRTGRPAEVICELARQESIDLIIAGAMEREGLLESLATGSIARRIARRAPCSVLLLAQGQSPAREGFREIVVATRLDEYCRVMLAAVAQSARLARTRVMHVVQELDAYETRVLRHGAEPPQESRERRLRWMFEHQEQLIQFLDAIDFSGMKLRVACLEAGEGIAAMDYAERCNADLLVYPAPPRRLTFWDEFFNHPGSVVLHRIKCALLFYRPAPQRLREREVS